MERIFYPAEEGEKRILLKGKRILQYRKIGRKDKKKIIEDSTGYVILDELKKEKTAEIKPDAVREKADRLFFYEKKYIIWKNGTGKADAEWKTEYLEEDRNGIFRVKESCIKGCFCADNEKTGESEMLLLVSKKNRFLPVLFLLLLFFLAVSARAFYHPHSTELPSAESPAVEFAEDATEYDDMPVMTEEPEKETEEAEKNSSIMLNVFADQTLSAGDTVPFANYSTNIDSLEFQVRLSGENGVIYDTGIIPPGQQVRWNVSETLERGSYCLDIYLLAYPADGSEASCICFQKNFNVVLE